MSEIIIPASEEGKQQYAESQPQAAKFLMPDGSVVSELGGGMPSPEQQVTSIIYVDGSYTGVEEKGSVIKPFKSAQPAIDISESGDCIIFMTGQYGGDLIFPAGVSVFAHGHANVDFTGNVTFENGDANNIEGIKFSGLDKVLRLEGNHNISNSEAHGKVIVSGYTTTKQFSINTENQDALKIEAGGNITFEDMTITTTGDFSAVVTEGVIAYKDSMIANNSLTIPAVVATGDSRIRIQSSMTMNTGGGVAIDAVNTANMYDPNMLHGALFIGEANFHDSFVYSSLQIGSVVGTNINFTPASQNANDSNVSGATVKDALNTLLSGESSSITEETILSKYYLEEGYQGVPEKILPISAPRAYYFTSCKAATPIFSPNGINFYKYVGVFGNGTNGTMVFSNDGKAWTNEIVMTGVTGNAYHAALAFDGINLHIWYWTGSMTYVMGNSKHAISSPALAHSFGSDNILTELIPGQILTGVSGTNYRRGSYGPSQMFYNAIATNIGTDPRNYSFWGLLNVTSGGTEHCVLIYSIDGISFARWEGNGDVPIIPSVAGTFYSYSVNQVQVIYDLGFDKWVAYFQGCSSNPNNQNVGLAYADDLLDLFTVISFPLYKKGEAEYFERSYCPWHQLGENNELLLYKTGRSQAGVYATFVNWQTSKQVLPLSKRGTSSPVSKRTPLTPITKGMLDAGLLPLLHSGIIATSAVNLAVVGYGHQIREVDFELSRAGNSISIVGKTLATQLLVGEQYTADYFTA